MNKPLPPFKKSPNNVKKAPAAPKRGSKSWAEAKTAAIVTYLQEYNGKRVSWKDFCKAVGLGGKELGQFLRAMLKARVVTQPDPEKYVYKVVKSQLKAA